MHGVVHRGKRMPEPVMELNQLLNLTDPVWQAAVTRYCLNNGFKLLVLDNLSCLFSGVKENDADAWEAVLPWLLELRRHRIAVLIVAHSGGDGKNMRGTSRREDAAFSVIRRDDPQETGEPRNGAHFLMRFTKDRNSSAEQAVREWGFQTQPNGDVEISSKQADSTPCRKAALRFPFPCLGRKRGNECKRKWKRAGNETAFTL